jgi:hypothetical protein
LVIQNAHRAGQHRQAGRQVGAAAVCVPSAAAAAAASNSSNSSSSSSSMSSSSTKFKVQGYTGFKPREADPGSPTEAITGDMTAFVADARATKFRRSAVEVLEPNLYVTNSALTQNNVTQAHYLDRPAPAKMPNESNNPPKGFDGKSSSATDYVDFRQLIAEFAATDPASYQDLFAGMDADGSGFLDKAELRAALSRRGSANSEFITDALMVHFDGNEDGRVSWDEFASGLEKTKVQLQLAVKKGGGKAKPTWELKKVEQKKVVSFEERPSMAQSDYTPGGFSSHPLTQGTPQGTQHVPGYSGHLPSSTYNPKATAQAAGAVERADKQDLILNETYNPRVKTFTEVRYGRMKTLNSINDRLVINHWDAQAQNKGEAPAEGK